MAGGAHRDEAAPLQAASAGPPPPIFFVAPAQAGAAGGIAPSSLHRPIAVPVCAGDDDQGITPALPPPRRSCSEEHTSALQSPMRHSYAVFCLQKKPTQ